MIQEDDVNFLNSVTPLMGITKTIVLTTDPSTEKYPDIWIQKGFFSDTITVTQEWARQTIHERRKRIIHELLHSLGENHWGSSTFVKLGNKRDEVLYSTYPEKDTYSALVYAHLLNKLKN